MDNFNEYLQSLSIIQLKQTRDEVAKVIKERESKLQEEKWSEVVAAIKNYCSLFGTIQFDDCMMCHAIDDCGINLDFCHFDSFCGTIVWQD